MSQLYTQLDKLFKEEDNTNYFHNHDDVESELIFGNVPENVDLSIMVPAYKRLDLLGKTLNSLMNMKQVKSLKTVFIVVSNDPDFKVESLNIPLDPNRVLIYRNKQNIGMCGNINRCCALSVGKYVAFCHDDDLMLDNYLVRIEKHLAKLEKKQFDCVVPNHYIYAPNKPELEKNIARHHRLRKCAFLSQRKLQRVDYKDVGKTFKNCLGGGPTCGVLFKRESLLKTNGFSEKHPFIFDFLFFVLFSFKHNVYLLDEFLSIYRTTDGASNRPEVQLDFFEGNLLIISILMPHVRFVRKNIKNMIYSNCYKRSAETIKLIKDKYDIEPVNKIGYAFYKARQNWYSFTHNLYRYNSLPKKYGRDL